MKPTSAPLTLDLPASLNEKIEAIRVAHDLNSASEAIRMALAKFDTSGFRADEEPRIQVSVRIDSEMRKRLKAGLRRRSYAPASRPLGTPRGEEPPKEVSLAQPASPRLLPNPS